MSQLANRWPFPDNPPLADFVRAVCAILNGGITVSNFSTGMKNTPKGVPTLTPTGKIRADQLPGGSAAFSTGDRLLCAAATAPTGWTQVATWNDQVIRVVNDGTGATTGGTWTISGLATTGEAGHTHSTPVHVHDYTVWPAAGSGINGTIAQWTSTATYLSHDGVYPAWNTKVDPSPIAYTVYGKVDTTDNAAAGTTGAGTSHTHPITAGSSWRPAYLNVIVIEAA